MSMPVSGPGPYSKRTDRQPVREPGGLPYGDNQALRQQQQAAPMAQAAPAPATPFDAPTANPGQPVTSGANAGPGPDQSVLGRRPNAYPTNLTEALANAAASDPSGIIAALLLEAQKRGM
jgi:hypothetical protein